ncbi:MAG: YvcK family protein [Coriobacteriales bacterium]|jgi:uncharacterized cofD-like protein|nr:YvcK family protein [Coriobacteriales bacterium]
MTPTRSLTPGALASVRAVCVGGGTGVPASIKALVSLGIYPDAVVSVADDGGSSGLLRSHTGQVPPGDLRKCLVALAADQHSPWVKAFKERFEYANNHTLGNLVLTALQETTGSLSESIALCEQLLGAVGSVYPASLDSILLMGITHDGQRLVGQSTLCKSETALARVVVEPADPPANPAALEAIKAADLLVFGPGSLFTSIVPNVLIPGIRDAVRQSHATTVFVCPLTDVQGETWGLNAAELTEALLAHGLQGRLDYALVNRRQQAREAGNVTGYFAAIGSERARETTPPPVLSETDGSTAQRSVVSDDEVVNRIRAQGVKVLTREMSDAQRPNRHATPALAQAFASIIADSKGL